MILPRLEPMWLFVYGTLGPAHLGSWRRDWVPDAVRGRLYDTGAYPILVDLDDPTAGWVEGHVRAVGPRELFEVLDPYEGVDQGVFERVRATTRSGWGVWVYVYTQPVSPAAFGPLPRWGELPSLST